MVTPPDIEAQILRYYHAEKWTIGTIAAQLHIHHGVVRRVIAQQTGLPQATPQQRPSQIDPYLPFILQTLEKFPKLSASRLYAMVRERGYPGRPDHFRHLIACHRPRPKAEAYLRLRTLPGEQAQVDWALCRARHRAHYAEFWTMPSTAGRIHFLACTSGVGSPKCSALFSSGYSALRKATSASGGLYAPESPSCGVVLARIFSFIARSASR